MKSISYDPNFKKGDKDRRWFKNVKLIGELDEGTSLYIEDYAFTYLCQYARTDLSRECSAVLIGESYEESDQIVIYGVIPIPLDSETNWISENSLKEIEEEKEYYFPKGEYVGWMHTQPGYGIMSTTKEDQVHRKLFNEKGVLLLMDPIHDEKVFFEYKDHKLVWKSGFCLYYEKNHEMQKYMVDKPLLEQKDKEADDSVVANFREIGARRKRELLLKQKRKVFVGTAVAVIVLTGIFLTGIYGQQMEINNLQKDVISINREYGEIENQLSDYPVEIVFTSASEAEDIVDVGLDTDLDANLHIDEETDTDLDTQVDEVKTVEIVEEKEQDIEEKKEDVSEVEYGIHNVKVGDSLSDISYRHYKTVEMAEEIANLNKIKNHDTIYIGQELKLPKVNK